MEILITLAIGALAGWLAGLILSGRGFGCLGNVIVGMIGSFVGWLVFSLLGLSAYGNWGYLLTSTVGALIFLSITGAAKKR
ncbi:MAG: GlsB/YeaQ/YmgE family stress response membrane protein [Candidatus Dojkabacteria bacterium]